MLWADLTRIVGTLIIVKRNNMLLSYLTLASGLFISLISEFYSIVGLMTIFAANPIPVAVMGVALGVGKIVGTVWLKQNWKAAPLLIKIYLFTAIGVLMLITSLGIFGLLSKAHSDQSAVSGDAQAKITVYDEKIKIANENIEANRRALKQLDDAVDQVMARSTDERGASKAASIRRSQAKERSQLLAEIEAEQNTIAQITEERAPIAAQIRQVEAEVGPIKYIAAFVYGVDPDKDILEKAVTWVIILLVVVFDPLAVVMLLAAQLTFSRHKETKENQDGTSSSGNDPVNSNNPGTNIRAARSNRRVANSAKAPAAPVLTDSNLLDKIKLPKFDSVKFPRQLNPLNYFKKSTTTNIEQPTPVKQPRAVKQRRVSVPKTSKLTKEANSSTANTATSSKEPKVPKKKFMIKKGPNQVIVLRK